MTALIKWKIALCLAAIFTAGAGAGVLLTLRLQGTSPPASQTASLDDFSLAWKNRLIREVKLLPEQESRIDTILDRSQQRLQQMRNETRSEIQHELQQSYERIRQELDEDQTARFDRMLQGMPRVD